MQKKTIHGIEIRQDGDGRWFDKSGVEYGLADESLSLDDEVRAGDHWTTDGIRAHDYAFSSPAYMRARTRSEADRMLRDHLLLVAGRRPLRVAAARLIYGLCRAPSWAFWENPETRWK